MLTYLENLEINPFNLFYYQKDNPISGPNREINLAFNWKMFPGSLFPEIERMHDCPASGQYIGMSGASGQIGLRTCQRNLYTEWILTCFRNRISQPDLQYLFVCYTISILCVYDMLLFDDNKIKLAWNPGEKRKKSGRKRRERWLGQLSEIKVDLLRDSLICI